MRNDQIIEWLGMFGKDWVHGQDLEQHQSFSVWGWVDKCYIDEDRYQDKKMVSLTLFKLSDKAIRQLEGE